MVDIQHQGNASGVEDISLLIPNQTPSAGFFPSDRVV
jgi:hypothetical protein